MVFWRLLTDAKTLKVHSEDNLQDHHFYIGLFVVVVVGVVGGESDFPHCWSGL